MTAKSFFTASDGAKIAYLDEGEGPALLCLSGLTRNTSDFDYMLPHLPQGWRVVRMDYRGRGESDWSGAETYTVPREGRDALELLDRSPAASAPLRLFHRAQNLAPGQPPLPRISEARGRDRAARRAEPRQN